MQGPGGSVWEKPNPLILGAHCPQRESKKQEAQLSLTMDLPLSSQESKDFIQSPSSSNVVSRETSQDMLTPTAYMSVSVLDMFVTMLKAVWTCLNLYICLLDQK